MSLKILAVDDSPAVLKATARVLSRLGAVSTADGPEEALRLLREDGPFDVVVSDVMMPGMTGMAMRGAVLKADPSMASRFVFLTGGVPPHLQSELDAQDLVLEKPCSPDALRQAVLRVSGRA